MNPYLELVRPPNVATALADVLAGFAIAGLSPWRALPWLLFATACLYAGGVALNDVFDRRIDAAERPERPLPSGRITVAAAATLGAVLLGLGLGAAAMAGGGAAGVAGIIVLLVVTYDAWGKRQRLFGPVNMGLCRGANLLLGAAVSDGFAARGWLPAVLVTIYIMAITIISRGEVLGGARSTATAAVALIYAALAGLTGLAMTAADVGAMTGALALTALLAYRVVPAFHAARKDPRPLPIRQAVKTGVLSLALADAAIAASYAGMIYCLALLATALLAGRLARAFAVT